MQELQKVTQQAIAHGDIHEAPSVLQVIAQVAADPRTDVAKLQQLLEMQERIQGKEAEIGFNRSMQAAQEEMRPVLRDAENPSTHSRYARLETIDKALRPVYSRHGFSLSFNSAPAVKQDAIRIVCRVLHVAGHSKEYELEGALDMSGAQGKANKTSIQGLGSSASYLRRYLTLMIFNVTLTNEDNDGNKTGFIDEKQISAVMLLLKDCGAETDPKITSGFLDYMKAKAVAEVHAIDFRKAVEILESKKRALAKARVEVPEVSNLPDPVERVRGSRVRCKGKLWEVEDTDDGHRWREVK